MKSATKTKTAKPKKKKKIILAYSGGLDTSIMASWLKENYDCEVIGVTANLGQKEDWDSLRKKALASGISRIYIEDVREPFVKKYLWPLLRSGGRYEQYYMIGTLSRPLIAERLVQVAHKERAGAICHGATGKGNDQIRFETAVMALDPDLELIAPWRHWDILSREDAMDYAEKRGIPLQQSKASIYSRDHNIWYISHEGGELEDPSQPPPKGLLQMTASLSEAPDRPETLELTFEKGLPVQINGKAFEPVALLEELNVLGGRHGVGVTDIIENRISGMKSRGIYECPGGTLLFRAHDYLESLTLDRDNQHLKNRLNQEYADLLYEGKWFSPVRESLDAFFLKTQEHVNGTVRLELYKGHIRYLGSRSDHSLFDEDLSTFGESEHYDQKDAGGFIKLYGLPMKTHGRRLKKLRSQARQKGTPQKGSTKK